MAEPIDWVAFTRRYAELSFISPALRATASICTFNKGDSIFRLGTPPAGIYFLLQGEVRLLRRSRTGGELILQRVRRGFFAEASLDSGVYHCDALAVQPSEILRMPFGPVRQALDDDAAFRQAWISHLSRELRRSRTQGERLALKSAAERVLHYLEREGADGVVSLDMPRKAWAAELGLTHESLYRTLARLEAEGRVTRRGPELRLTRLSERAKETRKVAPKSAKTRRIRRSKL